VCQRLGKSVPATPISLINDCACKRADSLPKPELTQELADFIYEAYRDDFERFGFARDSWRRSPLNS